MKKLPLQNPSFHYVQESFREWLDIQGYAPVSVYNMPLCVRELLYKLEQQGIRHIKDIDIQHIEAHYEQLKERSHQRRGGGLSNAHLNKHIQALKKFTDYLRKAGRIQLPALHLHHLETIQHPVYLSEEEIQQLYKATYTPYAYNYIEKEKALQSRDRAILTLFYGCGLRRTEGAHTNVSDINFDKSIIHVRKGKNYKERMVPVSKSSLRYLTDYIYDYRPQLTAGYTDALLLTHTGGRMQGQTILLRLKNLQQQTGNTALMEKEIGLHTLRHSIATHLLAAGMKLESIARFLGHSSLDSTQLYTHLTGIQQTKKQTYPNTRTYAPTQLHEDEP